MRTVVVGALALASGCNWVFGLDPVRLTDAREDDAPPDGPFPTVKLSAITPMLNSSGQSTGVAAYVPITPAPRVQYGRRGEALVDTVYNDTEVPVHYDFAESPEIWRLVYTLEGGVPHEVHWKPNAMSRPGHAVALQLTPNDRLDPPATGTFVLDATSAPSNWISPRLYTTNTWTIDPSPPPETNPPTRVLSHFTSPLTRTMAGPKRKPDPVKDFEVLLDYGTSGPCTIVTGSAAFRIDLATGTSIDPMPPMFRADPKPGDHIVEDPGSQAQTNVAGGSGVPLLSVHRHQILTYGPGGGIPLHHQKEEGVPLPIPVGILLAKCVDNPSITNTIPQPGFPSRLSFPTIGTVMYGTEPIALAGGSGVTIRNGLQGSIVGPNVTESSKFTVSFVDVAFAVTPTIDDVDVDVKTATSVAAVPGTGPTARLTFEPSVEDPIIDLYEATLYRIDGDKLVAVREFTFTEKPLVFDRDQGQPAGTQYVFAIRVIRGVANTANRDDFSVWQNTQWLGVTHTQAFTLD